MCSLNKKLCFMRALLHYEFLVTMTHNENMVGFILDISLVAYVGVYYNGDDADNYASILDLEIDVYISHTMLSKHSHQSV